MQAGRNARPDRRLITMYAPIFREKLKKLEGRGNGDTSEAIGLRETLAQIDRAQTCPGREERAPLIQTPTRQQVDGERWRTAASDRMTHKSEMGA